MSGSEPSTFEIPRFGTDGLRGPAGEAPLDPETLRRVGAALGIWLQRHGPDRKRVLVGNDGRDSAHWITEALAQGLATADSSAVDAGLLTTPALAFLTRAEPFVAGIMVSASHNAAQDNGIKLFDGAGGKLGDDAQHEIEELTAKIEFGELPSPRIKEEHQLVGRYIEGLANRFAGLDLTGATVVVDAANGGAAEIAPTILRGLGADVVEVACEPDGFNINAGCGALHPESLVEIVRQSGAVLGICLDGDGDRGIFVDDRGNIHDGDSVLATLGPVLRDAGRLPDDTVVSTIMTNLALRRLLREERIELVMTAVGDRHVAKSMRENGHALGAEQSGHVLFDLGDHLVGDGMHTALTLLSLPGVVQKGGSHALRHFERYPQLLVNVTVRDKPDLDQIDGVRSVREAVEAELGEEGRVVLRYSGTESLCRVMVEAPDRAAVERHVARIVDAVRAELGA